MSASGSSQQIHRISAAHFKGVSLTKDVKIRHSCDNPPCWNPDHLLPGTDADNVADKVARNRKAAKLTPDAVADMRTRYAARSVTQRELAVEYGVHQATISRALRGVWWSHLDVPVVSAPPIIRLWACGCGCGV